MMERGGRWREQGGGLGSGLQPRALRRALPVTRGCVGRGYCCKCVAPTCMDYVGRHVPHKFVRMCLCNTLRRAHRPCRSEVGRH